MTESRNTSFHTAEGEWLAAYSAGVLSDGKRLVLDCQIAMRPALAARLDQFDRIGGAFVETAKGERLSDDFARRLAAAVNDADIKAGPPAAAVADAPAADKAPARDAWMPAPLAEFLDRSDIKLKWRKGGPGVERAVLSEEDGERIYLLRARPGLKMPVHTHAGQEWTLVLQGGYHVGSTGFGPGDLHCEDETCRHQPIIDNDGEACISLVADEGRLIFRDPVVRLLQPFVGI